MKYLALLTSGAVLSIFLTATLLKGLDLPEVWRILRAVDPVCVAAFVATQVGTQITRAWRWGILVQPFCPATPRRAIWRISNVGNMLIMLLPARTGELARPYLLKREFRASMTAGMGAAVVERVLDGLLVSLMFFAATRGIGQGRAVSSTLRAGAGLSLLVFSGAFLAIILMLWAHRLMLSFIRRTVGALSPRLAERAISLLAAFVDGLRSLPDARSGSLVVLWTVAYWTCNAVGMWWLMRAFGWALPPVAGVVVVCVLVVGLMIPAGPGFIGVYQAAIVTALTVFDVPRADATAYSLVAWLLTLVVLCAFGLPAFFGQGHIRVGDIASAAPSG